MYRLAPNGQLSVLHQFSYGNVADASEPIAGLVLGSDGLLWGVSAGGLKVPPLTPIERSLANGLQVVLTKKVSALSGQVLDSKGAPALDATVVVFPANDKLWTYQSRFIKAARPDQSGRFQMSALPAEDYLVVALQGLEDGQAGDPDFLATIKDQGTRFSIADGETKAVDVKLTDKSR